MYPKRTQNVQKRARSVVYPTLLLGLFRRRALGVGQTCYDPFPGTPNRKVRIRAQIVWAKQHFALGRGDYHWQHEPCWYAVREGKSSGWSGDRTQSTLWEVANLNPFGGSSEKATGHGTQKPVELMRRPMLNNSARGAIIYDPFLGSGTTLIAAETTDRSCYGLDKHHDQTERPCIGGNVR